MKTVARVIIVLLILPCFIATGCAKHPTSSISIASPPLPTQPISDQESLVGDWLYKDPIECSMTDSDGILHQITATVYIRIALEVNKSATVTIHTVNDNEADFKQVLAELEYHGDVDSLTKLKPFFSGVDSYKATYSLESSSTPILLIVKPDGTINRYGCSFTDDRKMMTLTQDNGNPPETYTRL